MLVDPGHQLLVALEGFRLVRLERLGNQHLQNLAGPGFDQSLEDFAGKTVD